jgi:hypothetical protein
MIYRRGAEGAEIFYLFLCALCVSAVNKKVR